MYASANGSATPRKKERKVTILLRHTDAEQVGRPFQVQRAAHAPYEALKHTAYIRLAPSKTA